MSTLVALRVIRAMRNRQPGEGEEAAHPELARLVRQIIGRNASRVVARRANLSHTTVTRLLRGDAVQPNTLRLFAMGYKVPLNPLRRAMGLPELEVDPVAAGATTTGEAPPEQPVASPRKSRRPRSNDTTLDTVREPANPYATREPVRVFISHSAADSEVLQKARELILSLTLDLSLRVAGEEGKTQQIPLDALSPELRLLLVDVLAGKISEDGKK